MPRVRRDFFAEALPAREMPEREFVLPPAGQWPPEALAKRHIEIGDLAFERGYRQRGYSLKDRKFPNFRKCVDRGYKQEISLGKFSPEEKATWETFGGCDLSCKDRPGNAIFLLSVTPQAMFIPRLIRTGAWTSPEMAAQIQVIENRLRPRIWTVETNAYQSAMVEWPLAAQNGILLPDGSRVELTFATKVRSFQTTQVNKVDPEFGVGAMDIGFMDFAWLIPMGDLPTQLHPEGHDAVCPACRWIKEMELYPHAKTTDLVMACWFAWETALRYCTYLRPQEKTRDKPMPRTRKTSKRAQRGRRSISALFD